MDFLVIGSIDNNLNKSADKYLLAGFEYDQANANNVVENVITGDGNMVLKLYYKRIRYTVTGTLDGVTKYTQTVKHGASSNAMEFAPADQFAINSITVNGKTVSVENANQYTYKVQSNVTKDITVAVTTARVSADLTVSVTGTLGDQNFIFVVTDSNGKEVARVALYPGKTSVKIKDLPLGDYTVTPASGWAWRQTLGAKTVKVDGVDDDAEFTWNAVDTFIYWLNSYSQKKWKIDPDKASK